MKKYRHYTTTKSQMLSMKLLITLLLGVIIFLLSASFISTNSEAIVSSAQDVACRGFLQTYDSLSGDKLSTAARATSSRNLFSELGRFCKTDRLIFTSTEEEYVQKRFANAARKCYERYGSGELEFLDFAQREGSYCFVCAEIQFEDNDEPKIYKYREIGEWMSNTIDPKDNEERKSYRDLANLFYITSENDYSAQDFPTIEDLELEEQTIEQYSEQLREINQLVNYIKDTYTREIRTSEKSYVVFRYNAQDFTLSQVLEGAAYTAAGTIATGYALKKGACFLSGVALSFTGLGTIAGVTKTATCVTSTLKDGARLVQGAIKISKLITSLPALKIGGTLALASLSGSSLISTDIDPENPQMFIRAVESENIIISNRVKNQLDSENKQLLESIEEGDFENQELSENKREEVQRLILLITEIEVRELQNQGELPDFKQYTEIIPESEFYRQCGVVPGSRISS